MTAIINDKGQVVTKLPDFEKNILEDYVQGRVGVTPYQNYGNYPTIIFSLVILLSAWLANLVIMRRRIAD
jgi:Apolipoprotein N-acyltransferase